MDWYLDPPEGYDLPEGIGEGARADMRLAMDALHRFMQDARQAEDDADFIAAHFAAWEAELESAPEGIGPLSNYGYQVELTSMGFELYFFETPEDYYTVSIEGYGGAPPTREIAEAEAIRRIQRGEIGRAA
jgi:hypothetical protein